MQGWMSLGRHTIGRARLGSLVLVLGVGFGATAFAESMVCRMDPGQHDRYIAPETKLAWDQFGAAMIADAVIAGTGRKSVTGEVVSTNSKKLVATWQVRGVTPDPLEQRRTDANLVVRLTVERANGRAVITINDASSRKYSYRGKGNCRFGG